MSPHNVQAQGAGVSDDFRVPTPSDFTTSCLVFVSRGREESGVQGRRGTTLPLHVSSTGRGTTLRLHVVLTAHETIELTNDVAHVAAP
jgi:hypothetical protein